MRTSGYRDRLPASSCAIVPWLIAFLCLVPPLWLLVNGLINLLAVFLFLAVLLAACAISKRTAICLTLAYLFLLGDIRRIVAMSVGFPAMDPLLLVGPLVTLPLALPILLRLRLKDSISKAMLALMAVMCLEIVNPIQGPIVVGLAGAMFFMVPVLWFWIGREYGTYELLEKVIYKVVIPLAVLAALLGACQTFIGFLPWEMAWINNSPATAAGLSLGGGFYRAFGFSVNVAEYDELLLIASTCAAAAFFSGRRLYGVLFPGFAFMLFLASSRGSVVKCLFAVAAAWALSRRGGGAWALRLPLAIALGIGALAIVLSQISPGNTAGKKTTAMSAAVEHQSTGLEHPVTQSTAGIHATIFLGGFKKGFTNPIGRGIGAVTLGSKLGDDGNSAASSEVDISDTFVSTGIVGGCLYLYLIWIVIHRAIEFGKTAPQYLGLPALGILAAMVGSWLATGQYALSPLVWFVIGALARQGSGKAARPATTYAGARLQPSSLTVQPLPAFSPQNNGA
jgi:hypothetical protein